MRTGIVIATKTGALLEGCFGALSMTTPDIRTGKTGIFVVANGTDEERAEIDGLVRTFRGHLPPEAHIIAVPDSLGPWYGNLCHAGALRARDAGAVDIVFLNDDTYPGSFWLEALRLDMDNLEEQGHNPGLLGCRGNQVSGPQNIFDPTELAMRQRVPEYKRNPMEMMRPIPVAFPWPRIVTFAAMVGTEVYFKVGGFDLELPAHNYSDDILSYRSLKAGYQNWISGAFVAHLGSRTVAGGTTVEEAQAAFKRGEGDMKAGAEYYAKTCPDANEVRQAAFRAAGYTV